jgi:hypothetical protein
MTIKRYRALVVPVLVAACLLLGGVTVWQSLANLQRADRNRTTAATALDAAEQNCRQVRALGGVCAVNPSTLPRPDAGPPGPAGPAGERGLQGPPGPAPACLYEASQCRGLSGSSGAQGPSGLVGPAGSPGEPGPVGAAGEPGPAGATGPQGPVGPQGSAGPAGPACPDGYHLDEVRIDSVDYLACAADPSPTPSPSPSVESARRRR